MGINILALFGLVTSVMCLAVMGYIVVQQFGEVRRPRNAYTRLRWYLLLLPTVFIAGVSLRLQRLYETLYIPYDNGSTARSFIGGVIIIISATLIMWLIYTYKEKN